MICFRQMPFPRVLRTAEKCIRTKIKDYTFRRLLLLFRYRVKIELRLSQLIGMCSFHIYYVTIVCITFYYHNISNTALRVRL